MVGGGQFKRIEHALQRIGRRRGSLVHNELAVIRFQKEGL